MSQAILFSSNSLTLDQEFRPHRRQHRGNGVQTFGFSKLHTCCRRCPLPTKPLKNGPILAFKWLSTCWWGLLPRASDDSHRSCNRLAPHPLSYQYLHSFNQVRILKDLQASTKHISERGNLRSSFLLVLLLGLSLLLCVRLVFLFVLFLFFLLLGFLLLGVLVLGLVYFV